LKRFSLHEDFLRIETFFEVLDGRHGAVGAVLVAGLVSAGRVGGGRGGGGLLNEAGGERLWVGAGGLEGADDGGGFVLAGRGGSNKRGKSKSGRQPTAQIWLLEVR
jgi:hypothetical protein